MNANPWASPKSREIRRMLVSLDERIASACDIEPDAGADPHIVTLRHAEIATLRAHVYLHGQRAGTYGIFYEFPHPVPGILESEENLPLPKVLASLAQAGTPSTTWLALIKAEAGTPGFKPSSSTASLVTTA